MGLTDFLNRPQVFSDRLLSSYAGHQLVAVDFVARFVCDCHVGQPRFTHLACFSECLLHVVGCFRERAYGKTYGVAGDGVWCMA